MEYGLVLGWWFLFVGIWIVGLPISTVLFESVPRKGAGLALPVSLGILTLAVFWIAHVLALPLALAIGIAMIGVASLSSWLHGPPIDWRMIGGPLGVFTAAFIFLIGIRAVDPAVNAINGEKFLDFGLLRTLARTQLLPPEDMWFAGEPVRYYYGGHLLVALLAKLSGTPSAYAYNLGLAGYYAMLVTAVYELGAAVAASREESPVFAGMAAAFFVGVASNLLPVVRLFTSALPSPLQDDAAQVLAAKTASVTVDQANGGYETFSFWSASRIVPETINEFPLFAWLFGDLHAHMMSAPFLVLGAAVCHAYYRTPASALTRRRGLIWAVVPSLGGLITIVSTWGTPTLLGLVGLTLFACPADPSDLIPGGLVGTEWVPAWASPLVRFAVTTLLTTFIAGLIVAVAAPFALSLTAAPTGRSVALVTPAARSDLLALGLVHGAFLVVFSVAFMFDQAPARSAQWWLGAVGVVGGSALLAWVAQTPAILLFLPLIAVGTFRLREVGDGDFESILIVAGAGLALVVEWLYVADPATTGRTNTVFKSYVHLWVFWSIAAGVTLPWLTGRDGPLSVHLAGVRRGTSARTIAVGLSGGFMRPLRLSLPSRRRFAGVSIALLVVLSTSVYGVISLDRHFTGSANRTDDLRDTAPVVSEARPTLDATQFADRTHPGETGAIAWIGARPGTPRLATAPGLAFTNWTSATATLTGVPTVAGWTHGRLYHGANQYYDRVETVDNIYCGPSRMQATALDALNVSHVYVGAAERARYKLESLGRLDGVSVANRSRAATVYRVDQRELDSRPIEHPAQCTYNVSGLEAADGGTAQGRIFHSSPTHGNFSWRGPPMMLPPGTYHVTFRVDASGATRRPVAFVAVSTSDHRTAIAQQAVFVDPELQTITLTFHLREGKTSVEFRGFKPHDEGRIKLSNVSLTRRIPSTGPNGSSVNIGATDRTKKKQAHTRDLSWSPTRAQGGTNMN